MDNPQPATMTDSPSPDSPLEEAHHDQLHREDRQAMTDGESVQNENTRIQAVLAWIVKYRILLEAAGKVVALFLIVALGLALLLVTLLPPIDPIHRPDVKIPRSFDDLKRLNAVLQIYKQRNFGRVLGSFIAVYLFLQTFSVPGSMYLSILSGAMYGVLFALPLVCLCIATGATLCYLISALLGPALLLASKKWRDRLDLWRDRIDRQGGNMISYLMILRIAPLPPHWMVNIICPHLNISIPLFWISTFLGVLAPSFIHVQVGTTLDQMTSPSEFRLMSWRNFFGLAGVVVAVLIPVLLRYLWAKELSEAAEDVVEVTSGENNFQEDIHEQNNGHVEVIVHDHQSHLNGSSKPTSNGWSQLPREGAIGLPDDGRPAAAIPSGLDASRPTRWFSKPFGRKSEGAIRL